MSERRSAAYAVLMFAGGACIGGRMGGADWRWALLGVTLLVAALALVVTDDPPRGK